ncbi:MAG TPA: VWA domain-containing protein [Tepidisphaeraceae bacterium]|nr:VWA domain-containing protein [Tepidisphaeraceae bacterium]
MAESPSETALEPLPAADPAVIGDHGMILPPLSFWRKPWVQNVLPWVTSFTIHLGLIIIALATYQAAGKLLKVVREQIIIPDASLASDAGGVPNPGMGDEKDRTIGQDVDSSVTESNGFARVRSELNSTLVNTPTGSQPDEFGGMLIGSNGHGGAGGQGLAEATGGALAQFGNPGGGQIGPRGRVFGNGGNAMKIIFICDASGSMMTKMDLLKVELEKTVDGLEPIQAFNVIFFQNTVNSPKQYIELSPDLLMATAANKKKLYDFLQDIVGESSTYVIPALTEAFHSPTRPELIYVLTDGLFEDEGSEAVINAIRQLNAEKRVKINTILFLGKEIDADELKEASAAMQTIASENGGVYNQVSVSDLGN